MSRDTTIMELLFIYENHAYGGGEKMFRWVAAQMQAKGHNVKFCTIYNTIEPDPRFETDCLNLKFYPNYLAHNLLFFTVGFYRLYKYLKRNNPHNIVSFGMNTFYMLSVLKPILNYRILVSERGYPEKKRFPKLRKYFFSKANYAVFQTDGARKCFPGVKDDCCSIIPNPIKVPAQRWDDLKTSNIVTCVGRLNICQKRQDLLLRAFKLVLDHRQDYKLLLVGGGEDLSKLQSIARDLEISGHVEFTGFTKDVNKYLLDSRIFVMTSDFEGMPNSLMEAMALGMPSISTDCDPGGARYLINNYQNGIVVEKGNVEDICKAILFFIDNEDKRISCGIEARKTMEKFDEISISDKWDNAIRIAFSN